MFSGNNIRSDESNPDEAPNTIWKYTLIAAESLNKDGDLAILQCVMIKKESDYGNGLGGSPSIGDVL